MIRVAGIVAVALALALTGVSSAQALTLEQVGNDFDHPTYVSAVPNDPDQLLVVEREGTIQLLEGGVSSLFADLRPAVDCDGGCGGERGLLSIALSPAFASDGRVFVDYASDADGTIHIEELTAGPGHRTADPATLRPLLEIPHAGAANHNGGQLQFGPDGNLYISTGDGGGEDDVFNHAQDPDSLLGKILRLDPNSPAPATVWSLGLRNPFRFSFDRLNGDMTIGDVGQGAREEVDFAPSPFPGMVGGASANYGWNCREGFLAGPATDPECAAPPAGGFTEPVFDYPHSADPDLGVGTRCSIIGGYVVRDPGLGALYGRYLYTDFCSGALRTLQLPASAAGRASDDCSLGLTLDHPVSFGEDAARRLYVVERDGAVYRLAGLPSPSCPRLARPAAQAQSAQPPLKPAIVGIKPQRRRVERGKAAVLTVFVSPCDGRRGQPVKLQRNGRANGSRYLSRACTARFSRRIRHKTTFAATIRADHTYMAAESRLLTIRLAHRRHRHHRD